MQSSSYARDSLRFPIFIISPYMVSRCLYYFNSSSISWEIWVGSTPSSRVLFIDFKHRMHVYIITPFFTPDTFLPSETSQQYDNKSGWHIHFLQHTTATNPKNIWRSKVKEFIAWFHGAFVVSTFIRFSITEKHYIISCPTWLWTLSANALFTCNIVSCQQNGHIMSKIATH